MKKIKYSVEKKGRDIHIEVFALNETGDKYQSCGHLVMDQRQWDNFIINSLHVHISWKWKEDMDENSKADLPKLSTPNKS